VLVSTAVIENGINMPSVNTILICAAENFGLSTLYQLKGRVGRSSLQGYCHYYLSRVEYEDHDIYPDLYRRFESLRIYQELGSGRFIAEVDEAMRGFGDVLGSRQSGFLGAHSGLDLEYEMLQEYVWQLKQQTALPGNHNHNNNNNYYYHHYYYYNYIVIYILNLLIYIYYYYY
jgi:transcription-repair coupling factor (superfamily II helicase)